MMEGETLFKILFVNQDQVFQIFAKSVFQSELYGFIEIEEIVFGEKSKLVLDPGEEKLKSEFSGVKRSYVPMHAIIRIDEVEKQGTAKVMDSGGENVTQFPGAPQRPVLPKTDS